MDSDSLVLYRGGGSDLLIMPAAGVGTECPTFTRGPSGMLRVRQSYPLPDGGEVAVEGEQLSRQVLTEPG
jgi:hypothetical protein